MTSQGISWSAPVGSPVRLLVQATRGHSGKKFYDLIMIKVRLAMVKFRSVQPPELEIMGKIIASKKLWRCVKGSETAQFCTVHGRYFSWIHIAWFLGIQILQHFGMALATSLDTQKQRQPHEESLEIKRRHAFMLAGTLLNEYSHLDPGFEENC